MSKHPRRAALICLALLLPLLPVACGESVTPGVSVQASVEPPAGLKLEKTDSLEIALIPEAKEGEAATGTGSVEELPLTLRRGVDGTVVPGKYKVAVKLSPYPGMPESEARARKWEDFNGRFDRNNSPLSVTIPEGASSGSPLKITINLKEGSVAVGG